MLKLFFASTNKFLDDECLLLLNGFEVCVVNWKFSKVSPEASEVLLLYVIELLEMGLEKNFVRDVSDLGCDFFLDSGCDN